jgi:hypothetical protein
MADAANDTVDTVNEAERQRLIKRNIRRTGAALWLTVAVIFFYMMAKYYWMSK